MMVFQGRGTRAAALFGLAAAITSAAMTAPAPTVTPAQNLADLCTAKPTIAFCTEGQRPATVQAARDFLTRAIDLAQRTGVYGDMARLAGDAVALETGMGADAVLLVRAEARLAVALRRAGRMTEARAAVDQAMARTLPDSPEGRAARAALLYADGVVARLEGHYARGETALREALALQDGGSAGMADARADTEDALADLLGNAGKLEEAEALARRVLAMRDAQDPAWAETAVTLALLRRASGGFAEAESLLEKAETLVKATRGIDHPAYGDVLNAEGLVYRSMGKIKEAETASRQAFEIRLARFGRVHPDVATSANNLAILYQRAGRLDQAETLLRGVIESRRAALGAEHPDVGSALNNLAGIMRTENRLDDAENFYREAVGISVAALGPDHPDVATGLANLALVHRQQGKLALAEAGLRRALAIREKALPADHPDIAATLTNLGEVYGGQGRTAEAESSYERALKIQEASLGPRHPDLAVTINNLAALYRADRRFTDAEGLYRRSLDIRVASFPAGHPEIANSLGNLADLFTAEGKLDEAEKVQSEALALREKFFGPNHPDVATSLNNLAILYRIGGHADKAVSLLQRVIEIRTNTFGDNHPDVAGAYNNLAEVLSAGGQGQAGLDAIRKATAVFRRRAARGQEANAAAAEAERKAARYAFINHIVFLDRQALLETGAARDALLAEAFEIMQLAQGSNVGAVVSRMAARFAAGADGLAAVVRAQQDAQEQWRKRDAQLVKAALLPDAQRDRAMEATIRAERAELAMKVRDFDAKIRRDFPAYAEAISLDPVPSAQIQGLLRPGEALISYLVAEESTFILVLKPDGISLARTDATRDALEQAIRRLRQGLDPSQMPRDMAPGTLPPYDTGLAAALYGGLLKPIEPAIVGAKRLLVVPDGPLQALPLSVLVATPPAVQPTGFADYRAVDWLVRHYAISYLPSASSLRALRLFARGAGAPQAFMGVGAPRLGGPRLRGSAAPPASQTANPDGVDPRLVNQLAALPETGDELRAIAGSLHAPTDGLLLGAGATRQSVLATSMADYRVVAFATHGLIAGELKGLKEPALVLTPDQGDDGLLRASDIAQMRFNADWVVLSACNTAAGDGSVGSEGLTGLAKAFFYAGTRALLVSHWPVNSGASVKLTTVAVETVTANPAMGKAEALEQAMLRLMDDPEAFYAHPMMWAPFVVVGEGGAVQ